MEHATGVVCVVTKKLNVTPNHISMDKRWEPSRVRIIRNNRMNQNRNGKGQSKTIFKGTCNYCSKYGHKEADCQKKKVDEKKGNGKQETGATAIAGSDKSTEFLLYAGMECGLMSTKNMFPDSYDLLQMPEILIGEMPPPA